LQGADALTGGEELRGLLVSRAEVRCGARLRGSAGGLPLVFAVGEGHGGSDLRKRRRAVAAGRRLPSRLLQHAIHGVIEAVYAPIAGDLAAGPGERRVRWGQERDVRPIDDAGKLTGYLAKYSTKSTEQAGGLLHPIDADSVETAPVSEHVRGYLRAAFKLHELA
jgi:replication initiator protein RepSA